MIVMMAAFLSCAKERPEPVENGHIQGSIRVKAAPGEISNTAVWLYAGDPASGAGAIAFGQSLDGKPVIVSLPAKGKLYYRIICNLPESFLGRDLDSLHLQCKDFLPGLLPMSGSGTLMAESDFAELAASVKRRVARFSIEKITNKIQTPGYDADELKILGFHIENGVAFADMDWSTSSEPLTSYDFFNCSVIPPLRLKQSFSCAPAWSMASVVFSTPQTIAQGSSRAFKSYYVYACPNHVKADERWTLEKAGTSRTWTPRKTRLVIHCSSPSGDRFYAITMDSVAPGTWYKFKNINLKHAGSRDPDIPVEVSDGDFSLDMEEWTTSDGYIENI